MDSLLALTRDPPDAPAEADRLRVLIAAHSHPQVSNGGAEISAFALYQALQRRGDCDAWFLGCDRTASGEKAGVSLGQPFSNSEYIYASSALDWLKFANRDVSFRREIEQLFIELAPSVVHFHHYINFGVEIFLHLKRIAPRCKIILTLHEYLAICHHYGQMVTTDHHSLCYEATPSRCNKCFPNIPRSDFFLRKLYVARFFQLVDVFIAPSHFLANRYIAWGLPAEKVKVLENLVAPARPGKAAAPTADGALRIGFFGQISPLKGIEVMLDAAALLERENLRVSFEIYGDYQGQPPAFQTAFLEKLAKAGTNTRFHGSYDRMRVDQLMQSVHAVLVPSIWWENSPVVIQEALRNRRPVICSDIGGMAEKVRDGVDGFHFPVGNAVALASLIRGFAEKLELVSGLASKMNGEPALFSRIEDYIALYRS